MSEDRAFIRVLEPAQDLLAQLLNGKTTPIALTARCRARIEARDSEIMAWQALDWNFVQRQIDDLSERPANARGALFGLPVGVKGSTNLLRVLTIT